MNILIYVRPKSENFFRSVANNVFDDPQIVTFSDFNNLADVWAGKFIYSDDYDRPNADFEKEAPDILPRCRTLRKMNQEKAYSLALRYWNGMEEFFSQNKFDYLLTIPVDCYSLDIICRIAQKHNIHIISIIGSPFQGRAKITLRGEYNKVREDVPDSEIKELIDKMTKVNYLSPSEIKNVTKNHSSIIKFYTRRWLIENIYYPLLKLINRDPLNYHYNIYEVKGIPIRKRIDRNFEKRFKHISDLNIEPKSTVYYPLHLIPEATTDYWCPDIHVANYNKFILDMINNADPRITFIIKEHPAMYGRRDLDFYDKLNSIPNVILLHPMDRSNNLLQEVENVVVDNGTVGIEALLRGKRVICMSENYYYKFHPNAFRVNKVSIESLSFPLQKYNNQEFAKALLQGCFPSDFRNSRNGIPQSNVSQVVKGIKSYIQINKLPLC